MPLTPTGNSSASDHPLIDSFGRQIRDLRLSVTDRCNFRCVYCTDPGARYEDQRRLLSISEMIRVARLCSKMGITKVRVTGGEPTLHPELDDLFRGLADLRFNDIAMTTNGSLITSERARAWRHAGLNRITISIDSLRPDRFGSITRSASTVKQILESVESCAEAGLNPVRINAVVIRGMNDDEIADLAGLARRFGVDVRLIEYMPLDAGRAWTRDAVVTADEMIQTIARRYPLAEIGQDSANNPSRMYLFADGKPGRIGVISSVTRPFCDSCSRIRLTSDGMLRTCLFSHDEWNLRDLLRAHPGPEGEHKVMHLIKRAVAAKPEGHGIASTRFVQPTRSMAAIGG